MHICDVVFGVPRARLPPMDARQLYAIVIIIGATMLYEMKDHERGSTQRSG